MMRQMCKGKIHRAVITGADINYEGSITISSELMDAAGIIEYEKVTVADINNGQRFETYVICDKQNSGQICLNGAAAKLVNVGDRVIILSYGFYSPEELTGFTPKMVLVNERNEIEKIKKSATPYELVSEF